MRCIPQIFEKSAHVCNYYGIYVHVHCIAFVTILSCTLYTSQHRSKEINYYL